MRSLLSFALLASWPCATSASWDVAEEAPTPAQVDWIRTHGVPFATDDPTHDLADLEPLRAIVGDARIVALGECTHGTREVFRMKHRIVRFLAEEMGFTVFSIEANLPQAYAVGDWVDGGGGTAEEAVAGMIFWTWNTEEVVDMVRWMRSFRQSGRGGIAFTGFDMQFPKVPARNVVEFLEPIEPSRAEEVRRTYDRLLEARQAAAFGVVTWTFPVEDAVGKEVRYRGWIRTDDVSDDGFAGLWWRVDGSDFETLAFDNMSDRGPKGTTEWAEYEIALAVPEEAEGISFGMLLAGFGKAWFDDLSVEIDGTEWSGALAPELGFEHDITAYRSQGSHRSAYDEERVRFGGRSLRLESVEAEDPDAMSAPEAVEASAAVVRALEADRDRLEELATRDETERAIRNAVVVQQAARMRAREVHRDECMAENVEWILDRNPEARIVLWAHNSHVSRVQPWMGSRLADAHGERYLAVAFATGRGEYFAKAAGEGGGTLGVRGLAKPPESSIEAILDAGGAERLIVDLRRTEPGSPASGWAHERRYFRSIGAFVMDREFYPSVLADGWDVLVWFARSGAARQMDTPRPAAE